MNLFSDRQIRRYAVFLGVFCLLLLCIPLAVSLIQGMQIRDHLFTWEQGVVSSLVEQGVEPRIIVTALRGTDISEEGAALLRMSGYTEETAPWLLEVPGQAMAGTALTLTEICLILVLLLAGGSFFFFREREKACERAGKLIEAYREGDFTQRLSQGGTGAFDRMLASADRLATALKARSDTEEKARAFLKDMISDISHQLKTPLAALDMYMEIIQDEPENTHVVSEFAEKSTQSLRRMERLVYMLLKVAKLDAGSVTFHKKLCSIASLVEEAAEGLTVRIREEGKELRVEGDGGETVFCDEEWTAEALGNLIKNAVDHTEPGGMITVRWKRSPAMIRIEVWDDGCGIREEDIHHIFKKFYRSRNSSDSQGAGLGLPLAKSVAEGQGGVLTVQSTPGEGTVFAMSFLTEL